MDLIAKSLDVGNTGTVDPTAFIQEAHNFRHHRRAEQLHSTLVSRPAKPLAPPTWLSPRGRPFDPRSVAVLLHQLGLRLRCQIDADRDGRTCHLANAPEGLGYEPSKVRLGTAHAR